MRLVEALGSERLVHVGLDAAPVVTDAIVKLTEWGAMRFDDGGRIVEGWYVTNPFELFHQVGAEVTVTPAGAGVS